MGAGRWRSSDVGWVLVGGGAVMAGCSTHNSLFFGLPTYCTYHMVVKGTVIGNTDDSLQ